MLRAILVTTLPILLSFGGGQTGWCSVGGEDIPDDAGADMARNVVLVIADGMCLANEVSASRYLTGTDYGLSFHGWDYSAPMATWDVPTYNRFAWQQGLDAFHPGAFDPLLGYDPALGGEWPTFTGLETDDYFLTMLAAWGGESKREPATDSAAAATALATGHKTDRGNLSWQPSDPPDGALPTIAEKLREQRGGAFGVVSTMPFSHATPAGFSAHNSWRGAYQEIAREMLFETRPDVVIGAGHPDFYEGGGNFKYIAEPDLMMIRQDGEYVMVEHLEGANGGERLLEGARQAASEGKQLFGLFGGEKAYLAPPVPADVPGYPEFTTDETDPQLAESAVAALEVLSANDNGFFLMIEQGDLDWANHANDYRRAVGAMYDAHLAAQAVVDWINEPGDNVDLENTIVLFTSDHAHYMRLMEEMNPGDLPEQVYVPEDEYRENPWEYTWRYPGGEVRYRSNHHTNELVMLYATGGGAGAARVSDGTGAGGASGVGALFAPYEGSWYPGTRIIDNTQLHSAMAAWLQIE